MLSIRLQRYFLLVPLLLTLAAGRALGSPAPQPSALPTALPSPAVMSPSAAPAAISSSSPPATPVPSPGAASTAAPALASPAIASSASPTRVASPSPSAVASSARMSPAVASSPSPARAASPSPVVPPGSRPAEAAVMLNNFLVTRVVGSGDLSAEERARILEARLEAVLDGALAPPTVDVKTKGSTVTLQSDGVLLFTVTDRDASAANLAIMAYALEQREQLERELRRAWFERTGRYVQTSSMLAILLMMLGLVMHVLLGRFFRHRFRKPGWIPRLVMWTVLLNLCLVMFPHTRGFGHALYEWVLQPILRVTLVFFMTVVAWLLGRSLVRSYVRAWLALNGDAPRAQQRADTWTQIVDVLLNVCAVLAIVVGLLTAFKINATALLASAGIIGVALGVAAQDLLRDFTSGFAILLEDTYGVGDLIRIVNRNVSGTVESINIRATTLRNTEGALLTLPNSEMRVVENQSNQWSQADVRILVAPGSDNIARALALMETVGHQMHEEVPSEVLDEPQVLGIEDVGLSSVTLRMFLKTAPALQFRIRRQLLKRLTDSFELEGVERPRVPLVSTEMPKPT